MSASVTRPGLCVRTGVDLLPARCRSRLRARSRARVWIAAMAVYAGVVVCAWMMGQMPRASLAAELARVAAEAGAREAELGVIRTDVRTITREVELAREVSEHPDWSRLMALLAREKGDLLVLSRISVEPGSPSSAGGRARASGTNARAAYEVSITGTGASQAAVSAYVLALEKCGVFAGVTLVETRARSSGAGLPEVVEFSLRCQLAERAESTQAEDTSAQPRPAVPKPSEVKPSEVKQGEAR